MELTIDHKFISNMYELISAPNRYVIRQLLIYDCVSMSEIHFNLMKLFGVLYHTPIECSSYSYVLNSLVASYLKSFIGKSVKSNVLKHLINTEQYSAVNFRLHDCYVRSFQDVKFAYKGNLKPFIYSHNIPVDVHVNKSKNRKTNENEIVAKKDIFTYVSDFQSFILPLEQDYTKSSKGYNRYFLSINNFLNNHEKCIPLKYEINYQVQQDKFPEYVNVLQSKPNNEVLKGFDTICLQDSDNCTKPSSQKKYLKNNSESTFNYSLTVFADQVKQLDYETENNDFSSEDTFIFSENSVNISASDNSSIFSENSVSVSESDNSIVFTEKSINVSESEKSILSESCDDVNMSKFWDKDDSSSEEEDDECDDWNNNFSENSSDLFEALSLNFESDFPTMSFCMQSKMQTDNEPFSTYSYVNACFEDDVFELDDHIKNVNNNWNNTMKDVSSEPREAKRVSFVPLPDLVSVQEFEPDNDGYSYSMYVLDQVRFQDRIQECEAIISPYLTSEHRAKIYCQLHQCKI